MYNRVWNNFTSDVITKESRSVIISFLDNCVMAIICLPKPNLIARCQVEYCKLNYTSDFIFNCTINIYTPLSFMHAFIY